jgi:RNA polymerase sigma-70 factor (ECF subfamily)
MDGSGPADVELLAGIARGDEAALRELYERHAAWLLLRLRRRTPDPDLAAEAVHDTFVAVWKAAGSFRGEGDVGAWMWGIAIRQLISRLRKRSAPTPVSSQVVSALSPAVRSAEDELLVAVEHGRVGDALRALSPELRQAMQVTVIDGLTTREAAHLLGIPQGTVKSRVRRAKSQLREQLIQVEGW